MRRILTTTFLLTCFFAGGKAVPAASLVGSLEISGSETDLSTFGSGATLNRLGGFGSDLYYDRYRDEYYGVADRGPSGWFGSFETRMQRFKLEVDPATGQLANFVLQATIPFKTADGSASFDGANPSSLNGAPGTLGLSFDPESLVVAPNGHFFVGDEYGPSLYEFAPVAVGSEIEARFVRSLSVPDMFRPIDSLGQTNYMAERSTSPALVRGRQDNRGLEGLAISPDGTTLYAALQDPLAQEGPSNQGRRSRNVRIVQFDAATGVSTGQFIYQLEDVGTANDRIPGTINDFRPQDQGRDIGISALVALNDHELLVLERDTRGTSVDNPTNSDPIAAAVAVKRIYSIDLAGASDASALDLTGTGTLPANVTPVSKTLLLDIQAELADTGALIPERMEGLAVGPQLSTGKYALIVLTDNDFSVLLTDSGEQFDIYTDGTSGPVGSSPGDKTLIPTHVYSFAADLPTFIAPVPEPSGVVLLGMALFALCSFRCWRR
jgi:hypothetical protein